MPDITRNPDNTIIEPVPSDGTCGYAVWGPEPGGWLIYGRVWASGNREPMGYVQTVDDARQAIRDYRAIEEQARRDATAGMTD